MAGQLWFINGKAYDLEKWMVSHPGGQYILEITRGTDCTELFNSYHAPSTRSTQKYINATLAKYIISGGAPAPASRYDWQYTPILDDVRQCLIEYRKVYGIKATDDPWQVGWSVRHPSLASLKITLN